MNLSSYYVCSFLIICMPIINTMPECNMLDNPKIDVALVIDSSGSVTGDSNAEIWMQIKSFASKLVSNLAQLGDCHLGLLRYGWQTNIIEQLQSLDNNTMQETINALRPRGGHTGTAEALHNVYENIFTGSGTDRPNASNYLILITDGNPTQSLDRQNRIRDGATDRNTLSNAEIINAEVKEQVAKLETDKNVRIIGVVIQGEYPINIQLMRDIVTDDLSDYFHVLKADFQSLTDSIVSSLSERVCLTLPTTPAPTTTTPDVCASSPCQNEGTCVVTAEGYSCSCSEGFTGQQCETVMFCVPNPCQNCAICMEERKFCECKDGFTGQFCSTDVCAYTPCQNGGTCFGIAGGFKCFCSEGFLGENCQDSAVTEAPPTLHTETDPPPTVHAAALLPPSTAKQENRSLLENDDMTFRILALILAFVNTMLILIVALLGLLLRNALKRKIDLTQDHISDIRTVAGSTARSGNVAEPTTGSGNVAEPTALSGNGDFSALPLSTDKQDALPSTATTTQDTTNNAVATQDTDSKTAVETDDVTADGDATTDENEDSH